MIIECDACQAKFKLDDSKIGPRGAKVKCTKCANVFVVKPPSAEEAAVETPAPIPAPPTPKPQQEEAVAPPPQVEEQGGGFDLDFDTSGLEGTSEAAAPPPQEESGGTDLDFDMGGDEQPAPPETGEVAGAEEGGFDIDIPAPEATEPTTQEEAPETGGFDLGLGEGEEAAGEAAEDTSITDELGLTGSASMDDIHGHHGHDDEDHMDLGIGGDEGAPAPATDSSMETDTGGFDPSIFDDSEEAAGATSEAAAGDGEPGFTDFSLSFGDPDQSVASGESTMLFEPTDDKEEATPAPSEEPKSGETIEFSIMDTAAGGASEGVSEGDQTTLFETPGEAEAPATDIGNVPESSSTTEELLSGGAEGEGLKEEKPKRKISFDVKKLIAPIAALLVLGGGAFLYTSGMLNPIIDKITGSQQVAQKFTVTVDEVNFVKNKHMGDIFYVKGTIKNLSAEMQDVRPVETIVYNALNQRITGKRVSVAITLSKEELKIITAEELKDLYLNPEVRTIPGGMDMQVMSVFTQISQTMDRVELKVAQ